MLNLDEMAKQKADITARINEAMKDNDTEAFQNAFMEYTDVLQEAVLAEARGMVQAVDNQVLIGRGVRALTSQEKEFYSKMIDYVRQDGLSGGMTGFPHVLPETVIDAVFEDITEDHPLLSVIDFQNTGALIKYLYSTMDSRHLAHWGKLCSEITKSLSAEFKRLDLEQTKLSAYLPVCKAMLDLGPEWLDRYVRTILAEAIANGLEDGIINGKGIAPNATPGDIQEPIGMIRDLANLDAATGYAAKDPQAITSFEPDVYLPLIADLVKIPIPKGAARQEDLYRRISEVTLIVNPVDYLTKIIPATIQKQPDGKYVSEIFPFPTRVVQSAYVAQNRAILGLPKRYLMAMGAGTSGGKIEYSDEYQFLEDDRVYLIKLYGTGRPLDNGSFIYLNIENVKPVAKPVRVTSFPDDFSWPALPEWPPWPALPEWPPWPDATLRSLGFKDSEDADVTLDPATFSGNVHYYEGTINELESDGPELAGNKIALEATNENAVVSVTQDGTPVDDPDDITLVAGPNVFSIAVQNGTLVQMYTLVITFVAFV